MTRVLVASCVAAVCSVGLAAQTPPAGSTPQSPSAPREQAAQKSDSMEKSTVLRGCLRAGEQAGTYVLSNASATTGGTLKNATVELSGTPSGTNLSEHVGDTVEVTGMMAGASASASASGSAATSASGSTKPGATGTAGAAKAKLNVKSVKHVKDGC